MFGGEERNFCFLSKEWEKRSPGLERGAAPRLGASSDADKVTRTSALLSHGERRGSLRAAAVTSSPAPHGPSDVGTWQGMLPSPETREVRRSGRVALSMSCSVGQRAPGLQSGLDVQSQGWRPSGWS